MLDRSDLDYVRNKIHACCGQSVQIEFDEGSQGWRSNKFYTININQFAISHVHSGQHKMAIFEVDDGNDSEEEYGTLDGAINRVIELLGENHGK